MINWEFYDFQTWKTKIGTRFSLDMWIFEWYCEDRDVRTYGDEMVIFDQNTKIFILLRNHNVRPLFWSSLDERQYNHFKIFISPILLVVMTWRSWTKIGKIAMYGLTVINLQKWISLTLLQKSVYFSEFYMWCL